MNALFIRVGLSQSHQFTVDQHMALLDFIHVALRTYN
jgi:hypothetical protein